MDTANRYRPTSDFTPGDFYVENACCTRCGVPELVAPDLIGLSDDEYGHCYWKKQPETPKEMEQAFKIFDEQELGCHRYAGKDETIQLRVGLENCDEPIANAYMRIKRWGTLWSLDPNDTQADIKAGNTLWGRLRQWMK